MAAEGRDGPARWLTTAEAAARLGVKPETVYAYVSRGLLPRDRASGGRTSRFLAADVDRLAARGRAQAAATRGGEDTVVRSGITEIRDGQSVRYRGHDVAGLCARASFEQVAELLWTGSIPGEVHWDPAPASLDVARALQAALPPGTGGLDRLRVTVDAAATADPLRQDLRPDAVRAAARGLLPALVEALPPPPGPAGERVETSGRMRPEASTRGGGAGLAWRLWGRLTPRPPAPGWVGTLDAALVLLADHDLAPSTFAARVAASTRCDPYAVVACGLAVVGGTRHGAAGLPIERLLAGSDGPGDVAGGIAGLVRGGDMLPGFGHVLYRAEDPRARLLLDRLRALAPEHPRLAVVDRLLEVAAERGLPPPNVDVALAALTHLAGMAPGSAEVVFAVARCAGWVAHALEQYGEPGLLRPRAVYTGP